MSEQPGRTTDEPVDPELVRLYREASRETPPALLDAPILAAARREAGAHPHAGGEGRSAAYSSGAKRRSWGVPLALAAVVVLTVSILTLSPEMRDVAPRERAVPEPEPQAEASPSRKSETTEHAVATPSPQVPEARKAPGAPPAVALKDEAAARETPQASAAAPKPEPAQSTEAAPPLESRRQAAPMRAEADAATMLARQYASEPPEKWGEKIMELRRAGRAEDAEALLAEFRRRFPDYPVPPQWIR